MIWFSLFFFTGSTIKIRQLSITASKPWKARDRTADLSAIKQIHRALSFIQAFFLSLLIVEAMNFEFDPISARLIRIASLETKIKSQNWLKWMKRSRLQAFVFLLFFLFVEMAHGKRRKGKSICGRLMSLNFPFLRLSQPERGWNQIYGFEEKKVPTRLLVS